MRYAIVSQGVVANVVVATPEVATRNGWIAAPDNVGPGWLYDGSVFSAPPPAPVPVPQSVTMRQARLALLGAGLLSQVEPAIAAIPDAAKRDAAQITWEYSTEVQRGNVFIATLGQMLGLTDAQIDDLFRVAATL